jgi:transposase
MGLTPAHNRKHEDQPMSYIHFIGIDVSKDWIDVAVYGHAARPQRHLNTSEGLTACLEGLSCWLEDALIVIEATGGYETAFLRLALARGAKVHKASPWQVRSFIRSLGLKGKTDALDAVALARFAKERSEDLPLFQLPGQDQERLNDLLMRRADLVKTLASEKARDTQPRYAEAAQEVHASLTRMRTALQDEIRILETAIAALVEASSALKARFDILTSIKGIGLCTAYTLQAHMPELGTLTRKTAASLAGCAPHPKDSGYGAGKRTTFGGRASIKRALFLAALSARRFDPALKTFYERLIQNGKPKMVAITAIMRKLIIIANAKLKILNLKTTG